MFLNESVDFVFTCVDHLTHVKKMLLSVIIRIFLFNFLEVFGSPYKVVLRRNFDLLKRSQECCHVSFSDVSVGHKP